MQTLHHKLKQLAFIWQLIVQYRWYMPFILLIKICMTVLIPYMSLLLSAHIIQWLVDGISLRSYLNQLIIAMLLLSLLLIGEQVFTQLIQYHSELFRFSQTTKLNHHLLNLDYPNVIGDTTKNHFYKAQNLCDTPSTTLGRVFTEWLAIGSAFFSILLYVGTLAQLDNMVILAIIVMLICLSLLKIRYLHIEKEVLPKRLKTSTKRRYLQSLIGDNRIAKDVRLFNLTGWFSDIYQSILDEMHQNNRPIRHHKFLENIYLSLIMTGLSAFAYYKSYDLVSHHQIPISQFVIYVSLITMITNNLMNLIEQITNLMKSITEIEPYQAYLAIQPVLNHDKGIPLPNKITSIKFDNVSYTYPDANQKAINQLSFEIHQNEKIAIVGENGAGKTTLIKLLMGLLKPDEGQILINQIPIDQFNITDYYGLFAPVFQDYIAFTFTIKDAVLQGKAYDNALYQKVLHLSGVDQIIAQLPQGDVSHYIKEIHADAVSLSGGQLQKLKLAQALYKNAPVFIFDEPTAALDPIIENEIYQKYDAITQQHISLFISHRLASTQFCDRIFFMKDGCLVESGSHQALLANEKDYHDLFQLQAFYYKEEMPQPAQVASQVIETGGSI